MQSNTTLIDLILQLEEKVMKLEENQLNILLADDFVEFGSSGNTYTKKDQLSGSNHLIEAPLYNVSDFMIKELASGIILATYRTLRLADNRLANGVSSRDSNTELMN